MFIEEYLPEKNKKIESVFLDAMSDELAPYVLALALLFYHVTGPYWNLLGSGILYLDFYLHVVATKDKLEEWSQDSSTIFDDTSPPLFCSQHQNSVSFQAALDVSDETKEAAIQIFQSLSFQLIEVITLQLKEFLPGGNYHGVTEPDKRQKLAHSSVTNLLGEACFGDLDISIYTRRNASSHYHATMNMLVRNKTMKSWFPKKNMADQEHLLKLSAKKAVDLRQNHQNHEREVLSLQKVTLQQNKERQEQKQMDLTEKKRNISLSLHQYGVPCETPGQVDRFISRLPRQKDRKLAIQVQMNYYKLILGFKSSLLKISISND